MIFPTRYVRHISELCPSELRASGIDGLLLDIDGTLKDYGVPAFPESTLEWIEQIRSAGIAMCLFSNGVLEKVSAAAEILGTPYVHKAYKPSPLRVRVGLAKLGLPASRVALIGDQLFADVLAGRLYGLTTVLVEPTSWTEPWFTRLKRPAEMPFRHRMRRTYLQLQREAAAKSLGSQNE